MTISLNLDLPRWRKRAQAEADRVAQVADDAAGAVSGIHLPQVDVGGTLASARKAIGDARRSLADGREQVASGAEQVAVRANDISHGLRGAVDDLRGSIDELRSLRIVRQAPSRRDPWPGLALIGGVAAGIAAMFLLDPEDGRRRRVMLRDKLGKWSRVAAREARGRSKDIANRTQGLLHEVRSAMPAREPEPQMMAEGEPEWPSQEPVAAGVSASGNYPEMGYQPGAPNGRENG